MEKVKNQLQIAVPTGGFVDEGDGVVSFPGGLTITDASVQRNGTRYDIDTMDISKYGNQVTGDHVDTLANLIGQTIGVAKEGGRVFVDRIRYAVNENPYARLAYNLLVGGFSKNFSIETIGPYPDESTGIYYNAELVGLSQVVTQNNYNAHINKFNEVVHNSLEQSKKDGLDVTGLEQKIMNAVSQPEENKMEEKDKNVETPEVVETPAVETPVVTETPEVELPAVEETPATSETEEVKEEVKTPEVEAPAEVEVPTETPEEAPAAEPNTNETSEAEVNEVADTTVETVDDKTENNKETQMSEILTSEQIAEIVANGVAAALKPVQEELAAVKAEAKNAFDASAKEPAFQTEANAAPAKADNAYASMDFETRYQAQVDAAWNAVKLNDIESWQALKEINKVNFAALKEAGHVKNQITLDDLGNFVIAPEMYETIVGIRTDYSAIIDATEWRETRSLEFAFTRRNGTINMQSVALGSTIADGTPAASDDERLKPISEYSLVPVKDVLEELAAVTVVATSVTRFAAVDLLADVAAEYRNDYDRKRAQLVIAKLEEAVDETGKSTAYTASNDVDALTTWLTAITSISDTTLNGTLVFNAKTYAELKKRALQAGVNGPLSEILITGNVPTIFGYRFIVVPNDLMPSLGGNETIVHTIKGEEVAINHAVYFADLSTFTGRTSGGLQYDVSNSASYEQSGSTKSAWQRNELVLRGSFFRGGAIKDPTLVAGVRQGSAANVS